MDVPRMRFFAALALFLAWVALLAILAVISAHQPPQAAGAIVPRREGQLSLPDPQWRQNGALRVQAQLHSA